MSKPIRSDATPELSKASTAFFNHIEWDWDGSDKNFDRAIELAREVIRIRDAVKPTEAKWSDVVPTVPGWWWCRTDPAKWGKDFPSGKQIIQLGAGSIGLPWMTHWQWIGPIPEPK